MNFIMTNRYTTIINNKEVKFVVVARRLIKFMIENPNWSSYYMPMVHRIFYDGYACRLVNVHNGNIVLTKDYEEPKSKYILRFYK